jgi:DNA-binding response OmpR family regulator
VLRVLVCDDDAGTRLLLTRVLSRDHGALVTEAADGQRAIELLAESEFDLLVLDLVMPGLDGVGVLKALRARAAFANLPVVVLSSERRAESIAQVIQLGVSEFLLKPLHQESTSARLRAAVQRLTDATDAGTSPAASSQQA